jgi:hypothetical protein
VLLATRLTAHLWSLALGNHATGVEKRAAIRRAIEESDCRHAGDPHYQITRREAMGTLATLPLITFDLALPGREIATAHIGDLLAYSAASLEACWELYDRGETSEILLGFQCASRYLAVLRGIGQTSPPRRQEALRLATQYALLKTLLSRDCTGTAAITRYAREAIALSKETGDIPLHLSTFTKLTWTYLYEEDHRQALIAAQDAQAALERFEQQPGGEPLPPDVRDSVQCALALAQDRNRRLSRRALAAAMECDPGSEVYTYMMRPAQFLEAGRIDCAQNSYASVMEVLVRRVNRQTFLPSMGEIGQAETNLMGLSSSHAHDRDLEYTLHFWQAVLKGAKVRRSDTLFALACTTCRHRTVLWPGELLIRDLREHPARGSKA